MLAGGSLAYRKITCRRLGPRGAPSPWRAPRGTVACLRVYGPQSLRHIHKAVIHWCHDSVQPTAGDCDDGKLRDSSCISLPRVVGQKLFKRSKPRTSNSFSRSTLHSPISHNAVWHNSLLGASVRLHKLHLGHQPLLSPHNDRLRVPATSPEHLLPLV